MGSDVMNDEKGFERIMNAAAGIAEVWNEKTNNWLREKQITFTQFKAIIFLNEKGNQTLSQLSDSMERTRCTMTGLVDRLESKGLVKRKRSRKDRRLVYVSLTDKGRELAIELMDKVVPEMSRLEEAVMNMLTDTEIAALFSAFGKLNEGIGEVQTQDTVTE